MHEQQPFSPSKFWRVNNVFRNLTVEKCTDCGKGHIPSRPVCPETHLSSTSIAEQSGIVFEAKEQVNETTSY